MNESEQNASSDAEVAHGAEVANDAPTADTAIRRSLGELACAAGIDGDLERTRSLLAGGADARDPRALDAALTNGRAQCLAALLEHGADPDDGRVRGGPLHFVMDWCYRRPVVDCLLRYGADPNRPVGSS
ncbi:MAG: hypothetical protein R3E12_15825 [Candidatus Eisenbacteria bacterium]